MKKIKLFGALLLLLPGIASCGASDFLSEEDNKEEGPSSFDDELNNNTPEDNKTSDEKKEEPKEEPKEETKVEPIDEPQVEPDAEKYMITFYNGSVKLAEVEKPAGTYTLSSIYTGTTPTKDGDSQYSYSFKGWSDSSTSSTTVTTYKIEKNTPFYAVFNQNIKEYNITWKNYDNSTLTTTTHKYGTVPSYSGTTPIRPKEGANTYTFIGWAKNVNDTSPLSPLPTVTKADTYYAIYSTKKEVTKETLKADKRYLTSKGDGYTYLDYNLEEKYMSWNDLVSNGYITTSGSESLSTLVSDVNLDPLGKGVLQIPEDKKIVLSTTNQFNLFQGNELIDGVRIPAVTSSDCIRTFAYGCISLRTVEYLAPKSGSTNVLTQVNTNAFLGCTNLESVVFSNPNIKTIGSNAFKGCINLKTVTFPSGLETISSSAFENCSALGAVSLPANLKTIDLYGFKASGITQLTANSVVTIESNAFESCKNLTGVSFGTNGKIKLNGKYIFDGCTKLSTLNFSKVELTTDCTYAFSGTGFTTVDLSSASFTSIPDYAFQLCSSLTTVKLKSTIKTIGKYAFYKCSNLSTINTLSPSGMTLGYCCFCECSKLQTLGFTSGSAFTSVTLGDSTFKKAGLTSISVTASSLKDATNVFDSMPNLQTATVKITNDIVIPEGMFNQCPKLKTLNLDVKFDTSKVNTTNKTDSNMFYISSFSSNFASAFYECDSLETINFSGTADQFMYFYKKHASYYGLADDSSMNINSNTKLKIVCKRGYVKGGSYNASGTSTYTISNTNFASLCTAFSVTL